MNHTNCGIRILVFVAAVAMTAFGCSQSDIASPRVSELLVQALDEYDAGRNEEAIGIFSDIIQLDGRNAEALCGRGLAFHNRAFDKNEFDGPRPVGASLKAFQNAIDDFDQAIAIDANHALYFEYRADTKWILNQLKSASEDYTRSIELDPKSATSYASRAEVVASLGQLTNALADISVAIKLDPANSEFRFSKGCLLFENGDASEALSVLNSVEKEFSGAATFFEIRSEVLAKLGKLDEAATDRETATALRVGG